MSTFCILFLLSAIAPLVPAILDGDAILPSDISAKAVVFIDNGVITRRDERYCTGFLVSRWHVMTVGNCCKWSNSLTRIRVGSRKTFEDGECHGVKKYQIIPGLSMNNRDDEYWQACLIKMHRPVSIHQEVGYLVLPLRDERPPPMLTGYGYGSNRESFTDPQNSLDSVDLPVEYAALCKQVYRRPLIFNPRNTDPFFCYGNTNKKAKMVRFDSGGPLVQKGYHKAWGLSLNSQELDVAEKDAYPTFFIDLSKVADQINDAMKKLDAW